MARAECSRAKALDLVDDLGDLRIRKVRGRAKRVCCSKVVLREWMERAECSRGSVRLPGLKNLKDLDVGSVCPRQFLFGPPARQKARRVE